MWLRFINITVKTPKKAAHLKWRQKFQQIPGNYILVQHTTKL